MRAGGGSLWAPERLREMAARATRSVGGWRATLDAVEKLDYVGQGPAGYWGVSMGTAIGVPFVADEPREARGGELLAAARAQEWVTGRCR